MHYLRAGLKALAIGWFGGVLLAVSSARAESPAFDLWQTLLDAADGAVIELPAGEHALTNTVHLGSGRRLTVRGASSAASVIVGPAFDGALFVLDDGTALSLANLTLRREPARPQPNAWEDFVPEGFSRVADNRGTLTLQDCELRDVRAGLDPSSPVLLNYGSLSIERCVFERNDGAGLENEGLAVIHDSTFRLHANGAIENRASLDLRRTSLLENRRSATDAGGAGIDNSGTLWMEDCVLARNVAGPTGHGGGLRNAGTAHAINCLFDANAAATSGGGIFNEGEVVLRDCSITGNSAATSPDLPGVGGGIFSRGRLSLLQCTLSGNLCLGTHSFGGGGIYAGPGLTTIWNSTITQNAGGGSALGSWGGGLFAEGRAEVRSSLLAKNQCSGPQCLGSDLWGDVVSEGYNLIGAWDGPSVASPWEPSDLFGSAASPLDPLLAPLQTLGATTKVHPLLPGSAALDHGFAGELTEDQRHGVRSLDDPAHDNAPGSSGADIGAFERVPTLAPPSSVLVGPFPNLRISAGGQITTMAALEDGGVVLGGRFTSVNGATRQGLAKLDREGNLDPLWNPGVQGEVFALARLADTLFVGGRFDRVASGGSGSGGFPESLTNLARVSLNGRGEFRLAWAPNPEGPVQALELAHGKLLAGGGFSAGSDHTHTLLAALTTGDESASLAWVLHVAGTLRSIAVERNGSAPDGLGPWLYLGGRFGAVEGIGVTNLARLRWDGAGAPVVDPGWTLGATRPVVRLGEPRLVGTVPTGVERVDRGSLQGEVCALLARPRAVLVGGDFTWVGTEERRNLAKIHLREDGTPEGLGSWAPNPEGTVFAMTLAAEVGTDLGPGTKLFVGGEIQSVGGQLRGHLGAVLVDGGVTLDWMPNTDGAVRALLSQGEQILAAGDFAWVSGQMRPALVRLDGSQGVVDPGFEVSVERAGRIQTLVRLPNGRLVFGGDFLRVNGLARPHLARLDAAGTLDLAWAPWLDGAVDQVVADGADLFVRGRFRRVDNQPRAGLAKLLLDGGGEVDPLWNPQPDGAVTALALSPEGLVVGGTFHTVGGAVRDGLAKLDRGGEGAADRNWGPGAGSGFSASRIAAIEIAGSMAYVGGEFGLGSLRNLVRYPLGTGGDLDPGWSPNPDGPVEALAARGNALFLAGSFRVVGGLPRAGVAKLNLEGPTAAVLPWDLGLGLGEVPGEVTQLSLSDEALFLAGRFDSAANAFRGGLAKVSPLDASLDPTWEVSVDGSVAALAARGHDLFLGGDFRAVAGQARGSLAMLPVLEPPMLVQISSNQFTILRGPGDGPEVVGFLIRSVTGGHVEDEHGTPVTGFVTVEAARELRVVADQGTGVVRVSVAAVVDPDHPGPLQSTIEIDPSAGTNPGARPVFQFAQTSSVLWEGDYPVKLKVRKVGPGAGTVAYETVNGTAVADVRYRATAGELSFAAEQSEQEISVPILETTQREGDQTFQVRLLPTASGQITSPSSTEVLIVDDEPVGPGGSSPTNAIPSILTSSNRLAIRLTVTPPVGAAWRLRGELGWHALGYDSVVGETVSGLETATYLVEFKSAPGFREPLPVSIPVTTATSEVTLTTNQVAYTSLGGTVVGSGSLSLQVLPAAAVAAGAAWRLEGNATWNESGTTATTDLFSANGEPRWIEFRAAAQFVAPLPLRVEVLPGQLTNLLVVYQKSDLSGADPAKDPGLVDWPSIEAGTDSSLAYNGQIVTDLGAGSGVVVKPRVVLTASRVIFDEARGAGVVPSSIRWMFQEHEGSHVPPARSPRGYVALVGYAAQRRTDQSPGVGTPLSRAIDAVALFFLEDAGRGGYSGYLAAEPAGNTWLESSRDKRIPGYAADPTQADRSRLWASALFGRPFGNPVTELQTVFRTTEMVARPGNSGGAVYVRNDSGRFFPAGIVLAGSLGETYARAIDHQVVDLIDKAKEASDSPGRPWTPDGRYDALVAGNDTPNFLGPSDQKSNKSYGYVWPTLKPEDLGSIGRWQVNDGTNPDLFLNQELVLVQTGLVTLAGLPIPGYTSPTQTVNVLPGSTNLLDLVYASPAPVPDEIHFSSPSSQPVLSFSYGARTELVFAATSRSGAPVQFTVTQGAELASFAPGSSVLQLVTDGRPGVGTLVVRASTPGGNGYVSAAEDFTVTVTQVPQFLTFEPIADRSYGQPPFLITPSNSEPNLVELEVTGPAILSKRLLGPGRASEVTVTNIGEVTITATQPGNANFLPAAPIVRTFQVFQMGVQVHFGATQFTYDGSSRRVEVTTTPPDLPVQVTYNGGITEPTEAGIYAVKAILTNDRYVSITPIDTNLVIQPAPARITTLTDLKQIYTGTARSVSAVTEPVGLPFAITYDQGVTPPTAAGTYSVEARILSPNYQPARLTGQLLVEKARAEVKFATSTLAQTTDGQPRVPAVTTVPPGLRVAFRFGASGTDPAPSTVGCYPVTATVEDSNYFGEASDQLCLAPPEEIPLRLSIRLQGAPGVVLEWRRGTLQSAPEATGPWQSMAGASSPLTVLPGPDNRARFFRLQE